MSDVKFVVLYGGDSEERAVSLVSGASVAKALEKYYSVVAIDLTKRELPEEVYGEGVVVFPVFHGEFGEDGQVQRMLEEARVEFVGAGSEASRVCIDKVRTKELAKEVGIRVIRGIEFSWKDKPEAEAVVRELGENLVLKPRDGGSTLRLQLLKGAGELGVALEGIMEGEWMIEERVFGEDLTVGILDGKAMGIVHIKPKGGLYDYQHKYTAGMTEYVFPAELPIEIEEKVKRRGEAVYGITGCRDLGRVDFMWDRVGGEVYLLEINTIPGFTPTSLYPKSGSCVGYDFDHLVLELSRLAVKRLEARVAKGVEEYADQSG